jgi:hypothetical protein
LVVRPRFLLFSAALVVAWLAVARAPRADGGACNQLAYTFQPDCYHPNGGACGQTLEHLDFGPQIAVWLETADHTLVDTLMVTSLTASRGLGNRPGIWNFRSGPKFPYGKRWMSLPLWAYARGKLYPAAFMQDDMESWMGFHEEVSSKELYFCRPVSSGEVNLSVDVVTCPSPFFNSAKGKLEPATQEYYPPRNDLTMFTNSDCDVSGGTLATCNVSAASYASMNDLDAIAAATPAYGQPYTRTWRIPSSLPAGDYVVAVEVNKEYDTNASHSVSAYQDPALTTYGIDGNFGQPSVLYRVPIHLGGSATVAAATSQIAGYSKWTGDAPLDGTLLPRDTTISTTVPGSGEQRLLAIDGPGGNGRVHVSLQNCPTMTTPPTCGDGGCEIEGGVSDASTDGDASSNTSSDASDAHAEKPSVVQPDQCSPLPAPPSAITSLVLVATDAASASFTFANARAAGGQPVQMYDIHYQVGTTLTDATFEGAPPAPVVVPAAPGAPASLTIPDLKPSTPYVVGVRAIDGCGTASALVTLPFMTPTKKFTQLSGCFIATAAFGSALEPRVAALRHARDRLRPASPLFATVTELYYRAGPAAAAVVGQSDVARAVARRGIGPVAGMAEALDVFLATSR